MSKPSTTRVKVHHSTGGKIAISNAHKLALKHRGWILFPGITDESGQSLSEKLEVKWGRYKAGDRRTEWSCSRPGETNALILEGVMKLEFLEDGNVTEYDLKKGDQIFYDNSVPHKWICITDAQAFTARTLKD